MANGILNFHFLNTSLCVAFCGDNNNLSARNCSNDDRIVNGLGSSRASQTLKKMSQKAVVLGFVCPNSNIKVWDSLIPPPPPYSGLSPNFFWLLPSPDCAPSLPQGWGGKSLHRGGRSIRSRQSSPHESQQWWARASQRGRPCTAAPMSTFRTLLDRYNGDTVNMIFVNEEAKSLSCLPGSRNATALKETFSSGGGSDK